MRMARTHATGSDYLVHLRRYADQIVVKPSVAEEVRARRREKAEKEKADREWHQAREQEEYNKTPAVLREGAKLRDKYRQDESWGYHHTLTHYIEVVKRAAAGHPDPDDARFLGEWMFGEKISQDRVLADIEMIRQTIADSQLVERRQEAVTEKNESAKALDELKFRQPRELFQASSRYHRANSTMSDICDAERRIQQRASQRPEFFDCRTNPPRLRGTEGDSSAAMVSEQDSEAKCGNAVSR